MFTPSHYVPVLTGKAGELDAIAHARLSASDAVVPLIDVPPIPRAHPPRPGAKPPRARTPANVVVSLVNGLAAEWGAGSRILIDLNGLERYASPTWHAVSQLAAVAADRIRPAVVVSTRSTVRYVREVAAHADTWADIVVRFHVNPGARDAGVSDLWEVVGRAGLTPSVTDLIVDLGRISDVASARSCAELALSELRRGAWRSLVLASTSLPEFTQLSVTDGMPFDRLDWKLWRELSDAGYAMAFSDYGVTGPRSDRDDPVFGPSPHLRYTTAEKVWVLKGRKAGDRDEGIPYAYLCQRLMRLRAGRQGRRVFRGAGFSWGDAEMFAIASGESRYPRGGGGRNWVGFATSHHLAQVRGQLRAI